MEASSDRFTSSNLSCVESSGIMKMGTPDWKSFCAEEGSMAMLYSAFGSR